MERVRNGTERVDVVTWRSLATTSAASPATLAAGLQAYKQVVSSVRELHELGVPRGNVREVEAAVGAAYGIGINTLAISRRNPRAGRHMALTIFSPAMKRLERATSTAAQRQDQRAEAALVRARTGGVASLVVGVLLLALLGWRLHRIQGGSALAEQARAVERRGEERLHALVRHSSDVVAVIDPTSRVLWLAESVRGMLGYEPEALVGHRLAGLVHPDDAHDLAPFLQDATEQEGDATMLSVRLRGADGGYRHLELVADNRLSDPLIDGIVLNTRDVSERRKLLEQLRHQAFHDPLTGLANRALFLDRLEPRARRAAAAAADRAGACCSSTSTTSRPSTTASATPPATSCCAPSRERLARALRAADTAARLGGDEFAVLLEDDGAAAARARGRRAGARRAAAALHVAGPARCFVAPASASPAPDARQRRADELLRNADLAMYAAKGRRQAASRLFETRDARPPLLTRLELEADLRTRVERGELDAPLPADRRRSRAAEHRRRRGAGALAPSRRAGCCRPADFIPLAEETGLIVADRALGRCADGLPPARRVAGEHSRPSSCVSVNLSRPPAARPDARRRRRATR